MPKYTYTVNVTSTDIANGISRRQEECPVALALTRRFKNNYCKVNNSYVFVTEVGVIKPPQKVKEFIQKFDDEEEVKPFRFTFKGKRVEKCVYK